MGTTKIEWTEASWNPITGCSKISAGCQNCYAAAFAKRLKAMGNPRYKNGFNVTIHEDLFTLPLQWKKPQMIFVNSMSDLFHEEIPDDVILKLFEVMNQANWHTFQVLTKRTDRLVTMSSHIKWTNNIWMGTSIENDNSIFRGKLLKQCGAQIKFISAEPLIGPISQIDLNGIDWLIVGGESGPSSRPMLEEWALELQAKAEQSETAFFFKQWGGFNKKRNGCLLNGKEYKSYPNK